MANPTLQAEARDKLGTKYSRRLRDEGKVPAVIYGNKSEPTHISMDTRSFLDVLKSGAVTVDVELGGKAETCEIKDLQFDYLGDRVIHVDLTRV